MAATVECFSSATHNRQRALTPRGDSPVNLPNERDFLRPGPPEAGVEAMQVLVSGMRFIELGEIRIIEDGGLCGYPVQLCLPLRPSPEVLQWSPPSRTLSTAPYLLIISTLTLSSGRKA